MNNDSLLDNSNTEYAGFWIRVGASLIDTVWQVVIIGAVIWKLFGDTLLNTPLEAILSGDALVGSVSFSLYSNLLPALIIIPFWLFFGATPGKMLLGLKIVRAADGGPIKIGQSIVRFIAYIPAALILFIGFIMVAFDKRNQGLHDKLAGTVVIRTR